jgi:hypothetical protein
VVNAVPLWGLVGSGWAGSTLLVLYWCETLLGTGLNAIRILLHGRLTGLRGHYARVGPDGRRGGASFLGQYVGIALLFTVVHGVFLAALLLLMTHRFGAPPPDRAALERGVLWLAAAMVAGLAIDLARLRRQPFAWVRRLRDAAIQRVFLLHVSIIAGTVLMAWRNTPAAFFVFFALAKLALDVLAAFATDEVPDRPPGCIAWLFRALAPKEDADRVWRRSVISQRTAMARDEEVAPPGER